MTRCEEEVSIVSGGECLDLPTQPLQHSEDFTDVTKEEKAVLSLFSGTSLDSQNHISTKELETLTLTIEREQFFFHVL